MSSIRVLIADPNKYLLDSYRDYLSKHGFNVATARNGLECVEKLREFMPDIFVLEPSMPWGGGDGVLAMMHEQPDIQVVPVMILSYGNDPGVLYNIASFPINDFQKKPLPAKRLGDRLLTLLFRRPETIEGEAVDKSSHRLQTMNK